MASRLANDKLLKAGGPVSIVGQYMQVTHDYTGVYGTLTVVVFQVGSFYEMYGVGSPDNLQILDDTSAMAKCAPATSPSPPP